MAKGTMILGYSSTDKRTKEEIQDEWLNLMLQLIDKVQDAAIQESPYSPNDKTHIYCDDKLEFTVEINYLPEDK